MFCTKNFFVCVLVLFVMLFSSVAQVYADSGQTPQSSIVIINQVRGTQCCSPGSLAATQKQIDYLQKLQLPATFALRYDAILDPQFRDIFLQQYKIPIELAIFLEVTPQLAKDAGVPYSGPSDRWYKAKNAYLLGYSPQDRRKIIDTIFTAFSKNFGYYPTTTVAWMIDAPSLQYLSQKYRVKVHELTREQWGTDSYTLYGGPVNVPYLPSTGWPLIPAQSPISALPVLLLRQTITDPIYTYGDARSIFTSQPNDYLRNNFDISYFQTLLKTALEQQLPKGFAVVGLENSMPDDAQKEFFKQLESIHEYTQRYPQVTVVLSKNLSNNDAFNSKQNTVSVFYRDEKDLHAYWITTSHYRARVFMKGTHVWLDDLRLYSDALHDPYTATSPASLNAYWIAPFWFDASRYNTPFIQEKSWPAKIITFFRNLFQKNPPVTPQFTSVFNETEIEPTGFELSQKDPRFAPKIHVANGDVQLQYVSAARTNFVAEFTPEKIIFYLFQPADLQTQKHYQPLDNWHNFLISDKFADLQATSSAQTIQMTPTLLPNATMERFTRIFPEYMFPENVEAPVSFSHSVFVYSNPFAIAGQNPIRIVTFLKDAQDRPIVTPQNLSLTSNDGTLDKVDIHQPETARGEYYIDISSKYPRTFQPILTVGSVSTALKKMTFVADCKKTKLECLRHPNQLLLFLYTKLNDFLREK